MKRKKLTGKERLAKYAGGGELGPTPPAAAPYIPDAFQPFSQEYALPAGKAPKAVEKKLKLKDTRTINPVTGKPYSKGQIGSKSLEVDPAVLRTIIAHAKAKGVDPYDALAVPYQESNFGASGTGLGEVKDYFADQEVSDSFNELDERNMNMEANAMVKALADKFSYANKLGYTKKGKAYQFQAYNGYGKLKPPKGQNSTSYYGLNVTNDAPLNMAENPVYGKVVSSLRDVLSSNADIQKLVKETKAFVPYSNFATGGEIDEPDPVVPRPGQMPKNASITYDPRSKRTNRIDIDALLADQIGELIGNNYNPNTKEGKAILYNISQSHGGDFATDLNTRLNLLNSDPLYSASSVEDKLTTLYNTGKSGSKNALDTFLFKNKTLGGSPATYYQNNPRKPGRFAQGGEAGANGWGVAGQMLPVIGNALMSIFDSKGYTNQPIMNAQTAKNMTSPYAFGGELDDIDGEQLKAFLQAMFYNQADAEEAEDTDYETLEQGIDEESMEEDAFAMGGKIKINPKNKGKFNALKKRTGKTTEQLTHSKNPLTRKRAIFAQNAAKWKHAMGGMADIEVEGEEVIQTPDGQMSKMKGPSHDNGGIDVTVPEGTKIYSDRLQLEGKTMQQRKLSREKRLAKANKLFSANPSDAIARNTFERTQDIVNREEEQDMALQKIANKIYSPPKQAAYGDEIGDPWSDLMYAMAGNNAQVPYMPGQQPLPSFQPSGLNFEPDNTATPNINIPVTAQTGAGFVPTASQMSSAKANQPIATQEYSNAAGLTTGDYIGLGANLFNAIAPIINTRNAARATKPEINRFQGFGKQAMEANAKAQGFAGVQAANAKRNLDTATNSAILRNRLGARSVNTQRALDTVTDINRNKAAGDIYAGYTTQLTNLLGQEAGLANQRDQIVMAGAQARDEREAQNIDNYYSNMAENLTNFGTNIGNIGRNLNISKANQDNTDLLSQMSEYFDFGRDKNGKLVLKNKSK